MKITLRNIIAGLLTILFLAITLSPLATLAMRSPAVAHAVTGECSGNCDICGCSPERRANHTCCCSLKRQMQQRGECAEHAADEGDTASADIRHEERNPVPDCCRTKQAVKRVMVLRCNCPCGKGKLPALWGMEKYELLPCQFTENIVHPQEESNSHDPAQRLTSRHNEPPDPPPKLSPPV